MNLLNSIGTLMHENNEVRRGKILDAAHAFLLFIWLHPTLLPPPPTAITAGIRNSFTSILVFLLIM
jgi:hypothetical protein